MRAMLIFALMNAALIACQAVAALVIFGLGQAVSRSPLEDTWGAWFVVCLAGLAAGIGTALWLSEIASKGHRHDKHRS